MLLTVNDFMLTNYDSCHGKIDNEGRIKTITIRSIVYGNAYDIPPIIMLWICKIIGWFVYPV